MLCHVMHYVAYHIAIYCYSDVLFSTGQLNKAKYSSEENSTVQYSAVQKSILQHSTVQHSTLQDSKVGIVQNRTEQ